MYRWIDEGTDDRVLLLRVGEFQSLTTFLVLDFGADAEVQERVMSIAPDLARLLNSQLEAFDRLAQESGRAEASVKALDHEECGVIVLRRDQSIVMVNRAARRLLDNQIGLHIRRDVIRPNDYHDAVRFQEALDRVIDPVSGLADDQRATAMLLSPGKSQRPAIIAIAPLPRDPLRESLPTDAAAVIYVLQPFGAVPTGLETVCRLHNLSRVETMLLVSLTMGLTIAEAASQMRIKVDTARAYLKQIFAKTGVHRQAELVALVFGYLKALKGETEFQAITAAPVR